MAEALSAFLSVFLEKLASETFKKFGRSWEVDSEVKEFETSLVEIQSLLADASQTEITEMTDLVVKIWLNDLQNLAYNIDNALDDLETKVMHRELTVKSGSSTSNVRKLISTFYTNLDGTDLIELVEERRGELANITKILLELVEHGNNLGLEGESPKHVNRISEPSFIDSYSIIGRESDTNALLEKLLGDEPCDKNFSIVPIVGMGGVGKTTLARLLYEENRVNNHFELKAWVCVSSEFDMFNITQTIFQAVAAEDQQFTDLNMLQKALKEKISNKRFLFVLDDVWSENYDHWEILARPFFAGAPGSIVGKCDGLPLALIAFGNLLRSKRDVEDWKYVLNREIWMLEHGDQVIPVLRLSYQDLSVGLQQLFAYLSLFPKGYEFDKQELVLLWMAEGFLHQSTTTKSMEHFGLQCFKELLSKSFFQHSPSDKSMFVMHDLMHDLATSVAGVFFSRLDIQMKTEFWKEALERCRHVSFVCEQYTVDGRLKALKGAKSLRTFLALSSERKNWKKFYISSKIVDDLLHGLPLLRVLNLSQVSITKVPELIGSLTHLRYLNLSQTGITHLPDNVCNLLKLQTLIVFGCYRLNKLPESFSNLKGLRHLDIGDTPLLKKMPFGIGELKSLQTLSKIIIEGNNGFSMTDLKDLKDLRGKISIMGLDQVQRPKDALEANFSQKMISELEVEWSDVLHGSRKEALEEEVLDALKPGNHNLKKLRVVSYGGLRFPKWVGDPSFLQLAELSIYACKRCTSLPLLGQLPSLKQLSIGGMDEVKLVGPELLGTDIAFPSLESLSFGNMQGWEVWSTDGGVVNVMFPCLRELELHNCPNLVEVSLKAFPSLRVLGVSGCDHEVLRHLVHVASSVTMLDIRDISGLNDQAWGGVMKYLGEVEEVRIRSCDEIRYLWESETEASKVLLKLRRLNVSCCSNLVSLGEKKEDNCENNLTSLTVLDISCCNNMEHVSCPNNIESLSISYCDSVTSVSFPKRGGQKLKSVAIGTCKKLLEEELGGGEEKTSLLINSSMRFLESVYISCWPNLKSINEMSSFIHLTTFSIRDCPSLESFPDHEISYLVVLKHLTIQNCQSMNISFPRGLWPPNLCSLRIGGLKKPMSEWGPQNFPMSLVDLHLLGGPSENVRDFGQLSHLLPSSLTSLGIYGFEKLELVSMGLQHLTSLNHLKIDHCPNTKDLPEMLLPSLYSLTIHNCPHLKERSIRAKSGRKGSYWPLISLIPNAII